MKICHVIYIPRFSGAEILVRNLAIEHQAEGHEIAIAAIMPPETSYGAAQQELESSGVSLFFPSVLLNKWARLQFLAQVLKTISPDVIFAHAVIPSFYARYAVKLAKLSQTAVVSVLHDASQDDYASPYFRIVEKWLAPQPTAIVTVSPQSAENYHTRIRTQPKAQVILNGIELDAFEQEQRDRAAIRQAVFKANESEIVCLQVGRISTTKQQHYSLQAFAKAAQTDSFLGKLCFVGIPEDRAYDAEIRSLAAVLGISERVMFLGGRSDVPQLLAASDLYLMPSQAEAHSVAFIEALASGITIVASDISSFQFGLAFPGVTLISPDQIDQFAGAIVQSGQRGRWQRDLSDYSIQKTSHSYLDLSHQLACSK